MQHLYPPQHGGAQPTASEIEAFRARQRMQFRHQQQHVNQQQQLYEQHLRSLGAGNQAGDGDDNEDDDRVRKVSLTKRRQQFQQQFQQQQQIAASRTTKLPNFGLERCHQQQQQHMTDDHDAPSPVPHEAYTMFNAFDYGNSPEAFSFAEQKQQQQYRDDHNSNHDQQMTQHDDDDDDKSIWQRRFASDDVHVRRSPKLGRVALWDSNCTLGYGGGNNQFSHLQPYNHQ